MKAVFFILTLSPLLSLGAEFKNYVIKVDWNNPRTLEESVTQTCDDTHYPEVEIRIPGKAGKDFQISIEADITHGKLDHGCSFKKKVATKWETYKFEAQPHCTVRVYQLNAPPRNMNKAAIYEINEAC